jgi:hypothetical protein
MRIHEFLIFKHPEDKKVGDSFCPRIVCYSYTGCEVMYDKLRHLESKLWEVYYEKA